MPLSYSDLVNGKSVYFSNLAIATNRSPGVPLPDVGNYAGNGPNDFWKKAEADAQT